MRRVDSKKVGITRVHKWRGNMKRVKTRRQREEKSKDKNDEDKKWTFGR